MSAKYKPDVTMAHQVYRIDVEKRSSIEGCFDRGWFSVHSQKDMKRALNWLKRAGFSVQVTRITRTPLEHEAFPSQEETA